MKKILLPEKNGKTEYYRANLHCHSTVSDGKKTVEELKRDYSAHGYSIIAFTDHNAFITHNDLTDDSFLALNGYEVDLNEMYAPDGETRKTTHLCFVALDKDNDVAVCHHREKYIWGGAAKYRAFVKFDDSKEDFEREYSPNCVNRMIKEAKEGGFFVTYNHPVWSCEGFEQYSEFEGMDAIEIVNYSCLVSGFEDENGQCYEELLNQGKKVFCIAADDNHNRSDDDDPYCDSYGGYTMIAADKLDYESVADALKNGMFYASTGSYKQTGPEILSLEFEDGKLRIKTSPARNIRLMHNRRVCRSKNAEYGKTVTEAEFDVDMTSKWFRLTVIDEYGYKAYTHAYYIADLL